MIERWVRTDPAASHTIAATVTFHQDSPPPLFADIDEHCGYHDGYWVPAGPKEPSFGPVTLVAPKLGTVTFPSPSGYEPAGGLGWDTGDKLKLTAPGGDLPGFDLEDEVPAPVAVTSVDLVSLKANQLTIDRSKPYPLTWVPVSSEVFVLFLQFVDADYPLRGVLCFFPGQTGAAELPTAVLGHLIASKDVPMTNLYISGASRKTPSLPGVKLEMVTWNGRAARIQVQ